jgi:HD-GYP domain-containing protein (c-di-GMP phosphodiesterase class II)/DNA-binding CsgD family transcriptional regulator
VGTSLTFEVPAVAGAAAGSARTRASIAVSPVSVAAIADALEAALRARAPAQHAGTPLVRKLAAQVSGRLGLPTAERLAVDICAQVRDVGMIALPDSVVLNTGPLSPEDWGVLSRHPELGAGLLQSSPALAAAAEFVRAHHERWDGDGYPDGLRGEAIPVPSRVVAVCDAFVSLATDGPHRRGIGAKRALESMLGERDAKFDPDALDGLLAVITGKLASGQRTVVRGAGSAGRPTPTVPRIHSRPRELRSAIAELDTVPAFEPALERALATAALGGPLASSDLVRAIERDIGLTVAVLRAAQLRSDVPVSSVPAAVTILPGEEIRDAIAALPTVAFPWMTGFESLLLRCGAHAQAVARATDRLAQTLRPFGRDELVAAALLHDVGKLLLALVWPDFAAAGLRGTPEEELRRERREFGVDHASLGGLLAERWGLSRSLARAVSGHHSAHGATEDATLIRLADMVVHHAHGDAVDQQLMLRLATRCDVPASALRAIVLDLPQPGGGARRRAQRSPLSGRETSILQLLAEGVRASGIAERLVVSESTVRTHCHNIYAKLEVADRAQAVLRASEMGWI